MKSILQTKNWAEFKKSQGFEIFEIENVFVHKRNLPFGQNFLYIPEVSAQEITPQKIEEFKKLTKAEKSIFLRIEFIDRFDANASKVIQSFGLKTSFEQVQPKWRQIIDVNFSEDEILGQMKQKGRYNIKLALRKGVRVQKGSENLDAFYKLYSETTSREKITGRSHEYFKKMLDSFKDTDYFEIFVASYEGKPVASCIISFCDEVASYLYGGSSREHKEVMAPYLMHWHVIKEAQKRGCKKYDLIGRTAPGKEGKWSGVTRFKEQFGGQAVEILGSYDFVNQPFGYNVFKLVEKIRRKES